MTSACGSLQDANIGSVTGSATYDACNSDTISISANNVPSSTADKQYSVQREVCGDGEVIVRVLSVSGGLAGLELRASNAPGAIKVGLRTVLGTSVQRFVRTSTDGAQSSNNTTAVGHKWLKLVRSGSSVSTYTSQNGSSWNFAATYTISLPTCVQASLLVQSVNVNTTHTGVFKELQFSGFTNPEGDPTTVAFDQDTISADAGDTVMICVNIANPCVCSPSEVDVELQGSGSPHLAGYATETLVFDDTTSQQCFPLAISGAAGSANYTLSLDNVSGGNGAEAVTPESLILEVTGEEIPVSFCGALPPHTATSTHPDSILFDRFGNTYDKYTQSAASLLLNHHSCVAGYFELRFETDDLTTNEESVICEVFSDIAQLVPRRLLVNACEDPVSDELVVIEVQNSGMLAADVVAAASPYFNFPYSNSCESVVNSLIYDLINGVAETIFPPPHGLLDVDADINWYTGTGSPGSQLDLYSAILHEAMHLLGFASLIRPDGDNASGYSLWDTYLFSLDNYIPEGANENPMPLIEGDCEMNCQHRTTAPNLLVDQVMQNCLDNDPDIVFGDDALAPVSGGEGQPLPPVGDVNRVPAFLNRLSHLRTACNGSQPNYVMQPSLLEGEERRTLTTQEIQILCRLGYQVEGVCNGCFVTTSSEDGIQNLIGNTSCCSFDDYGFICQGQTTVIPFNVLLCNDITNDEEGLTITDASGGDASGIQVNLTTEGVEINAFEQGWYLIQYTVSGCTCSLQNAYFRVTVGPCNHCEHYDPCENLICDGTFEAFEEIIAPGIITAFGDYWVFEPFTENSPDPCDETTGNTYFQMSGSSGYSEGIALELQEPVEPGCEAVIRFSASSAGETGLLNMYGSETPPCPASAATISRECLPTDCGDYIFSPICIEQFVITDITGPANNFCPDDVNFGTYEMTWVNTESFPVNFLVFTPEPGVSSWIYLDDLVVTRGCITPEFEVDIEDCTVTITSDQADGPNIEHSWDFGDGNSSVAANPVHTYAISDTYTITHEITDGCLTQTETYEVTVECPCPDPIPSAEYEFGALNDCGLYRFRVTYSEGVTGISWNFGGTVLTGEEVDFTFIEPGEHTFTLTLTNSCGLITTYEETFEVEIDLPDAGFTPTVFCLNTFFEAVQTEGNHFWDFGDGETDDTDNPTPQHTFEEAGTYTVEHTFTNACGFEETEELMVTVTECDEENFTCPCEAGYNIEAPENGEVLLSTLINTGTLPAGFLSNTCMALLGRLIIDVDYTFLYIEGRMHSGAEIVVQPSATLVLNSVTRDGGLHGCEEMWRGIRVFGSGEGLLRSKGSLISDAQYAVHALDKSTLDIQGTTFSRNFVGIFFELAPGVEGSFELLPFHNNTFDGAEDLLLPYDGQAPEVGDRPFAGISITNCAEPIHVGVTAAGVNTFRDIHNGILTLNTPLSVERSVFENVVEVTNEPEYAFTGFGVRHQGGAPHPLTVIGLGDELTDDASFSNCTNAIWGIGTNANITENNMENVVTGVRLEFCTQRTLTVVDNRINAILAGVDLFQNAPAASISVISNNIYMNEGNGALGAGTAIRVEENTLPHPVSIAVIDDNRIIAYGWFDQGIRLSSASTWNVISNSIKLEGVEPSAIGINVLKGSDNWVRENQVEGESSCFGINVNASGNIFLECNTVTANYVGLNLVGDNSGADVATTLFSIPMVYGLRYTNGILAPIQNGRGNRWEGAEEDYEEVAAVHEGDDISEIQGTSYRVSEFYNALETYNEYPPNIRLTNFPLLLATNWFRTDGDEPIVCEEQPQFTDGEEQLNLAHRIAKDSVDNFPAGTVWDARWGLYERLLKNPALMSDDTILSDFFDETELTTLGKLVEIEQAKAALFGSTSETEAIALFAQDLDSLIQLIQEVDSIIVADSLTVIPSEREEWHEAVQFLVDTIQSLAFIADSLRLLEIETLIEDNDEITATTRPEKNQRTINKLYLDVLAKGSLIFTQSEKDTLAAIAMQCPQMGGRAVFVARAMRAYFSDASYLETEPCVDSVSMFTAPQNNRTLPQELLKPQQDEEAIVKIFPNPAGNYFMISYEMETPGQLRVHDLYGRVRMVQALAPGKHELERIATTDLQNGVYMVTINQQTGDVYNLRLLIVK